MNTTNDNHDIMSGGKQLFNECGEKILYENKMAANESDKDSNHQSDDGLLLGQQKNEHFGDFLYEKKVKEVDSNEMYQNASHRSVYNPCMADTHTRIFGECPISENHHNSPQKVSNSTLNTQKISSTTLEKEEKPHYGKKPDGNPLTGEGYEGNNSGQRAKVPPGGYSTGLW